MFRTSICLDSGACVPIANSGPSCSPGSFRPSCSERSAPVGPPSTASGPRSLRQQVRRDREELHALARQRHVVVHVGDEHDPLLLEPVEVVERRDGGEPRDAHLGGRAERRQVVDRAELELLVVRRVVAADDRDLELPARAAGGRADLDELALEEAVAEPARAVGARQAVVRRVERRDAGPQALAAQVADERAGERLRAQGAGQRARERDRRVGHRARERRDRQVVVEAGDRHAHELAGDEALVEEAAEVAAVGARQRQAVAGDGQVAEEQRARRRGRRSAAASRARR